ncbi:MAG: hypothetical protein JOZ39_11610 [Chloroflexi bacterium]|nr:hypothetical protein [Chloroflexota bacterium]
MPFEASADKVEEAHHFLLLMRVAELPPEESDIPERLQGEPAFRFSFSAFLSATRTILYLLQEEGNNQAGFTRWYVTARERWLKTELAQFFGDRRQFRLVFPTGVGDVMLPPNTASRTRVEPVGPTTVPIIDAGRPYGQVRFWERPGEAVTDLCAQYLQELATVVEHARQLAS